MSQVSLSDFPMEEIKPKVPGAGRSLGFKKALFVIDTPRPVLEKSSRNIPDVKMIRWRVSMYDLLKYNHVVLLEPSVV